MVQAGNGPRFALESLTELGIVAQMAGQYFQRNGSVQARIARTIDFSHTAGAQFRQDSIRSELCSRGDPLAFAETAKELTSLLFPRFQQRATRRLVRKERLHFAPQIAIAD